MKKKSLVPIFPLLCGLLLLFTTKVQSQDLFFNFDNVNISPTECSFDVMVSASSSGTFLSRGMIYLDYSMEAFGSNLYPNGNVSVNQMGLLAGTFKYITLNEVNNKANTLAITWELNHRNQAPNPTHHSEILTTPMALYRITIPITNFDETLEICFTGNLMNGQQFQLSSADTEITYGNNNFSDCIFQAPLSVELSNFDAHLSSQNTVFLDWITASETNNSHFEIERSTDTKTWKKIGKVTGAGTTITQQVYHFEDKKPNSGLNYYRLKQVEFNGEFNYSKIKSVNKKASFSNELKVFPNPASNYITVELEIDDSKTNTAYLLNSQGLIIQNIPLSNNWNREIKISNLTPGVYFLQIQNEVTRYIGKFIKN